MLKEPFHLSDDDLLLVVDGELSRGRAKRARAHLADCSVCRSRAAELEGVIADFVSLQRRAIDPQTLAATGPRATLKSRLAETAAEGHWPAILQLFSPHRPYAYLALALLVTLLGGRWVLQRSPHQGAMAILTVPDSRLTPGATRPVSIGDVCSMPHEEVVRGVPGSLREQVFREYGIANARPQDYEIDYLIAPGLGGTEDIHNLWPEPSVSTAWNAHDKDALEERLHQMVCAGDIDLPTAQKAIASDWIAAYKKYLSKAA
jgi:hypothetical protein